MRDENKKWTIYTYSFVSFLVTLASIYTLYCKNFVIPITEWNGYSSLNLLTGSFLITIGSILSWILWRKVEFLIYTIPLCIRQPLNTPEAMGNAPLSSCKSETHKEVEIYFSPGNSPEEGQIYHQQVLKQIKETDPEEYGVDKINPAYQASKYAALAGVGAYMEAAGGGFDAMMAPLTPKTKAAVAGATAVLSYKAYDFIEGEAEKDRDLKIANHRKKYEKEKKGFGNNEKETKRDDD